MSANRLSGVVVACAGLLLLFLIIPANTESVDYGRMRPQTIPDLCAILLVAFGVLHAIRPRGEASIEWREVRRFALFAAIAAVSLVLMGRFGFPVIAPVTALVVMLLIGERRWIWLATGALIIPAVVWLLVVQLLERTLP